MLWQGANLNPALQRLSKFRLEHVTDVPEVDLAARHHDADELPVVGTEPLHRLVEALPEVQWLIANHFHWKLVLLFKNLTLIKIGELTERLTMWAPN